MKYYLRPLSFLLACAFATAHATEFRTDFESGSIGTVTPLDTEGLRWQLALRDDNDDASLPNNFRTWWYVRALDISTTQPTTLSFTRIGWNYDFRPVYSYDNKHWQYFADDEAQFAPGCNVAVPDSCRMTITKTFDRPEVWIARTFPYPYSQMQDYVNTLFRSPYVFRRNIGMSPLLQLPIPALTISAPSQLPRQRVVIHARTHPAETGPSYVLEGLIDAAIRDDELGRRLRSRYVFEIVPMHNVDGVQLGNYRTNATSLNLENRWFVERYNHLPLYLMPTAPLENRILNHQVFAPLAIDQRMPTVLALNLHSSNSAPNTQAFFFPHFGSDPVRYTPQQIALWHKQLDFIRGTALHYDGRVEQPPADGGSGFLNSSFIETWWWQLRQDQVNAITLETTYGRAGFDHWITQDDLRELGVALAKAIDDMGRPAMRLADPARANDVFRAPFKPEIYTDELDH
ncbi:MAG TPA: M14-type cytosolic carboxypeptidase [Dyella sp.]|uniref:M14-type cytosolic carboxypeptidase n=1 Tax=Dyella sp. TaxID=1869338 RepID=UPI002F937302